MLEDVVVLMAHYNDPEGLEQSLESIQEEEPVKVVVVDDGSSCKPDADYLQKRFSNRLNLTILFKEYNSGPEDSANYGIAFIIQSMPQCKYIARLDCKDICMPHRLQKQKQFLLKHPEVALVGAWVDFYSTQDQFLYRYVPPSDYKKIRREVYLSAVFIQPVVMMRLDALKAVGGYPRKYPAADDYALYFELTKRYPSAIIPEVLLKTIFAENGVSLGNRRKQLLSRLRLLWDNKAILNIYWWGGLLKVIMLLLIPYAFVSKVKEIIYRK